MVTQSNFFPSEYINTIFESPKNNCLFVGTGQKGLLKLDFKTSQNINQPEELILNSLSSIVMYKNRILVAGSFGKIFEIKKGKAAQTYLKTKHLISSLSVISDTLYIGTWGAGILKVVDKKIIGESFKNKLYIHAIYKDSKHNFWVGTNKGIYIGKNIQSLKHISNTFGNIICFFETKNKKILAGSSIGIFVFSQEKELERHISRKDGFRGKEVRSFYEDETGKIWIGSYNGGLFCLDKQTFLSVNSLPNCKLPDDIFCLAKDENGFLYFTGNLGLYSVSEKKLNDFYNRKIDFLIPFKYGEETGIYNTEFNGGFQHNYLHQHSNFYFPTIEGINIFQPIYNHHFKSRLHIKEIYVNNKKVTLLNSSFLPTTHSIKIIFSKANYNTTNQQFWQYKLEKNGKTRDWSELSLENKISLDLLGYGDYVLKIRAVDSFNFKNPEELEYKFEIQPYFYQTFYFYILFSLIILLFGGISMKIFLDKKSKKRLAIQEINKHISDLKIAAIQARMSPHFIFNSLNTIKYFLLIQKIDKAESTLDNFSMLLRKFLNYSDSQFIELKEELNLLNLYVKIEQERFNNSFEFHVQTENIESTDKIPTMLIQPFIENAIKHGISNINRTGKINLKIIKMSNALSIEITDNGIGFIKKDKSNYSSKGINLVEGKINVLREKYNLQTSLEIESIKSKGTNIKIIIKA